MKKVSIILFLFICFIISNAQQNGTFKDPRDGKIYKTVKIGAQTWFVENISYKVNNGCWAYDDDERNVTIYGLMYTWESAMNVCPSGWHLPSDQEWTILSDFLGGEQIAGGKLKSINLWVSPNISASNSSGFKALPGGGRRDTDGVFGDIGLNGIWWTSTKRENENAWIRLLNANVGEIIQNGLNQSFGCSVRCVKDK